MVTKQQSIHRSETNSPRLNKRQQTLILHKTLQTKKNRKTLQKSIKNRELLELLQQTFTLTDGAHKRINCCITLLSKLCYH